MADPIIDVKFSISPDAKSITIEDDTTGWGGSSGIDKSDITGVTLTITDNSETPVTLVELTDNYPVDGGVSYPIDTNNTLQDEWTGLSTDYLPDGVYNYTLEYTYSTGSLTKNDGVFYSTRIIEGNINKDLLDFITGVQAFNRKLNFPKLEEIRRRDNLLFAVESAEFLSEKENVEDLISLIKRLE
jgi:hypothetical protein